MQEDSHTAERKALHRSALVSFIVGCVGMIFAAVSASQAILLDGLFNLTYALTGLYTLKVARLLARGDDEEFPFGYAFFEPFLNGLKGFLVFGVSLMALYGAVQALLTGGRSVTPGAAIGYACFATLTGWMLAWVLHRAVKTSRSPLVEADAKNWLVNGAISSAVLLGFLSILVIRKTPLAFVLPYIDPTLVLILVLVFISVPIRMAWQALMELLNRALSPEVLKQARELIVQHTAGLPVQRLYVRAIQAGRTRMIMTHVVLPTTFRPDSLTQFDTIRQATHAALQRMHRPVILDMVFTANSDWGRPQSIKSI